MNNLLSKVFSADKALDYANLRRSNNSGDVEAGQAEMTGMAGGVDTDLRQFFQEVGVIKDEMDKVKKLLVTLQNANEETKSTTRAQALKALRDRMDAAVADVLRNAKLIKARLEELDKSNIANRRNPGCEQGSSIDRTRMSVTNGLRKALKDLMSDFQDLRQSMMSEYRETIERRFYTVTGTQADEETIDHMIDTGESETFLQRAVQEQGKGQIIETIKEIQERHETVKEIEKNLIELHQIFMDMAVLVEAQGEQLNSIEASVLNASSIVKHGTEQLHGARTLQKNSRKWRCIAIIILLIVIIIIVVPILIKFIPSSSSSSSSSSTTTGS